MNDKDNQRKLAARALSRAVQFRHFDLEYELCSAMGMRDRASALKQLAALLQPRTSMAVQTSPGDFYGCSECGYDGWADEEAVTPYCPMCGAAVAMKGERVR